jgi:hypothetical protein
MTSSASMIEALDATRYLTVERSGNRAVKQVKARFKIFKPIVGTEFQTCTLSSVSTVGLSI